MTWDVEGTDEFLEWFLGLDKAESKSVANVVDMLEELGPRLGFPHSSKIVGSSYGQMRELRIQHQGRPYRVLYAFDPRRSALLLLGGDKTGDDRWYDRTVPRADQLFGQHLKDLQEDTQ
jgi:hypothetical protein